MGRRRTLKHCVPSPSGATAAASQGSICHISASSGGETRTLRLSLKMAAHAMSGRHELRYMRNGTVTIGATRILWNGVVSMGRAVVSVTTNTIRRAKA